jgi:hypothetical protein
MIALERFDDLPGPVRDWATGLDADARDRLVSQMLGSTEETTTG